MKKSAKNNKGCLRVSCLQRKKDSSPFAGMGWYEVKKEREESKPCDQGLRLLATACSL